VDYPSDVVFVTRLAGFELARIHNAFNCAPERNDLYSEHAQWIPQYVLEGVLRRHAESLPSVDLRFNCEFVDCLQDADGVRSRILDRSTGEAWPVHSDFLVGADGARSRVREVIGARMEGEYGLSFNYNIVFRAPDLAQAHAHGPAVMYWQVSPDTPSLIGPMDRDDLWFFMPTGVKPGEQLSDEVAAGMIRRATGIDGRYEIRSRDEWVASRFIADRYRQDRVFLAGDACHLHPPFGGYGMNMGVSDAVDLGWKIAAVLRGWGGAALLDSYEQERRPVHQQVIDEAVANHAVLGNQLWREGLDDPGPLGEAARAQAAEQIERTKRREFKSLGVVLGYRYMGSPVIAYEDQAAAEPLSQTYRPSARPGCLAPHRWLSADLSLYDLFGEELTLLALEEITPDEAAGIDADARAHGVDLKIVSPGDPALRAIYEARLVLIRPDQHVAWRGQRWPGPDLLALVSGQGAPPG
jgi:2-polyprenyl-6-methoxyphenol hydroxylase-like FAD-dependent oxidoreductase